MARMIHFSTEDEALDAAEEMQREWSTLDVPDDVEPAPVDVLMLDGDTVRVHLESDGTIRHERLAGHYTHGWCLDPDELPCICSE